MTWRGCRGEPQSLFAQRRRAHPVACLEGSDGQVLEALTAVMSSTAAQRMRDDLDTLARLPVTAIQAAQDEAGATLRRLAAEGAIQFPEEEAA